MILMLSLMALAAQTNQCQGETTIDLIQCEYSRYRAAEAALDRVWAKVKGRPLMLRAQRAWIVYKDTDCEIRNPATPKGREYPIYKYACLAELTEQRVVQLSEIAAR